MWTVGRQVEVIHGSSPLLRTSAHTRMFEGERVGMYRQANGGRKYMHTQREGTERALMG